MKSYLIGAFLLAAAPALAQQPPAPMRPVDPQVAALRDAALKDDIAWDIIEGLTTEVGQRLAGTEAEARGRDWAIRKLRALGFANVHVEPFDMPTWIRGPESAEILAPFPQRLVVTALGNSASTPPEGITGEVVGFDSLADLQAAPDSAVRGKIVFVSHAMQRTQDGSGYGFFGGPRRQGPTVASRKGAIAIVIRSIGTDYHRNPHTGVMTFAEGVKPIPAGALTLPDAEQLQRILGRGQPVTMRLTLVSTTGRGRSASSGSARRSRDCSAASLIRRRITNRITRWPKATSAPAACGGSTASSARTASPKAAHCRPRWRPSASFPASSTRPMARTSAR
jgi:hypothetical protein